MSKNNDAYNRFMDFALDMGKIAFAGEKGFNELQKAVANDKQADFMKYCTETLKMKVGTAQKMWMARSAFYRTSGGPGQPCW